MKCALLWLSGVSLYFVITKYNFEKPFTYHYQIIKGMRIRAHRSHREVPLTIRSSHKKKNVILFQLTIKNTSKLRIIGIGSENYRWPADPRHKGRVMRRGFCEARRALHCHSPQTTYSSKSTCCAISAQNSAMHVVVYATGRLTSQRSIVEIINWYWSYWQI